MEEGGEKGGDRKYSQTQKFEYIAGPKPLIL